MSSRSSPSAMPDHPDPLGQGAGHRRARAGIPSRWPGSYARATGRRPDIYYIILDGYARHDVMKSHFDFDNSAFLEHLEARVSTSRGAARPTTARRRSASPSSLNATYLDDLVKGLGNDQTELADLIGQE